MTATDTPTTTDDTANGQVIEAELIPVADETIEAESTGLAIREVLGDVLERQLDAGHGLSRQLVSATAAAAEAAVESPAKVIAAVRDGATLPVALSETRVAVRDVVVESGRDIRSAVGEYVGRNAVLPNAVIASASQVAGSLVRAQGSLTATAVDGVFSVAATAVQGDDVREAATRRWSELRTTASTAREAIGEQVTVARQNIRDAVA
jgi:hypothetical protein